MLHRIAAFITSQQLFSPRDRTGIALSGGADSLCLFHALLDLRDRWDLELEVIHVNHQLRGAASDEDEAFVEAIAHQHHLPFHLRRLHLDGQQNLEQAARRARLAFFGELRARLDKIATGHTRSDQAETVLFRLLRGSGIAGLAGILPKTEEGLVRPLLCLTRAEVEEFLTTRGAAWRDDATNRQLDFTRNRIRHHLIPHLEQEYNPGIVAQLAHAASLARDEEQFWNSYIAPLAQQMFRPDGPAIVLSTPALAGLPRAVVRRLLRAAIQKVKGDLREIEYKHVELALHLASIDSGAGRAHLPGIDLFRSFEWLRVAPLGSYAPARRVVTIPLEVPGEAYLPEARLRLRASILASTPPRSGYNEEQAGGAGCNLLDWDKLEGPLRVRYWLPGDSYHPSTLERPQKLKEMFQLHRIPLWERRFWPMIESSQGIVWTRRFGPAKAAAVSPSSVRLLRIEELSDD